MRKLIILFILILPNCKSKNDDLEKNRHILFQEMEVTNIKLQFIKSHSKVWKKEKNNLKKCFSRDIVPSIRKTKLVYKGHNRVDNGAHVKSYSPNLLFSDDVFYDYMGRIYKIKLFYGNKIVATIMTSDFENLSIYDIFESNEGLYLTLISDKNKINKIAYYNKLGEIFYYEIKGKIIGTSVLVNTSASCLLLVNSKNENSILLYGVNKEGNVTLKELPLNIHELGYDRRAKKGYLFSLSNLDKNKKIFLSDERKYFVYSNKFKAIYNHQNGILAQNFRVIDNNYNYAYQKGNCIYSNILGFKGKCWKFDEEFHAWLMSKGRKYRVYDFECLFGKNICFVLGTINNVLRLEEYDMKNNRTISSFKMREFKGDFAKIFLNEKNLTMNISDGYYEWKFKFK